MIIKVTSTQSKDECGNALTYDYNTKDLKKEEEKQLLEYYKRNQEQKLLKYEIIEY